MQTLKITSLLLIMPVLLLALPRFAVQEGTTCNLCHVDPNGGSLRNDYGITVASSELSRSQGSDRIANYTGIINDFLRLGGDIRFLNYNSADSLGQLKSAFFPMQADIAGYWQVNENVGVFAEQDLLRGQNEAWLLWTGLPLDGYVKAGKDLPGYGLNVDDHTSFIRGGNIRKKALQYEGLVFSPYLSPPGIVEFGINVGNFNFSQSIANQFINESSNGGFGEHLHDKAFTTRLEWWPALGSINGFLGGTILQQDNIHLSGLFGGAALGKFTWTGAVDVAEEYASTGTVLASYSELNYNFSSGLNLQIKYDFFDEDIDTSGSSINRITFGAEFFPIPFVEVRYQARFTDMTGNKTTIKPEYLLLVHTWF
jgi:hypothetical protein